MTDRRLFLHVGASKTGTSALQAGLFDSVDLLAEQGIGVPLTSRGAHVGKVLRPLGWVIASGFVRDVQGDRLAKLGRQLASAPGERLLVTCEDLCELDADRIKALVSVAEDSGHEICVVLSVRGLASVIPSEWQQFLKHRMSLDYPTFLTRVRHREGRWAEHFWLRQDVVATCERWAEVVGPERLDIVVTPSRSSDPQGLYRMFGQVVGFDPAPLRWPDRNVNASWGYVEAEVYRRVNHALGHRLADYDREYQPGLRWPFVQGVLPRGASDRIPLPPSELEWVTQVAREHVDWLTTSGIRVHGDLHQLVPAQSDTKELPPLPEEAVANAAVETLANFAVAAFRTQQRGRTAAAPSHDVIGSARRGVRTALRRIRR